MALKYKGLYLTIVFCLTAIFAKAQEADTLAPFQKHTTLPAFELLMMDSATTFSTYNIPDGKPIVLMFFSPDCDHCQMMTSHMLEHMKELKKARIYMLTPLSLPLLKDFAEKYKLDKYKNITYGKDYKYFFPVYYQVDYVPFIAVYDKDKNLVTSFEGDAKIEELIEAVEKGR